MTYEVITYLGKEGKSPPDYSWTRTMDSEEQITEYINYLTLLEENLPRKLRKALGPYTLVCSFEADLIKIPDAQEFQRLLEGAKFNVHSRSLSGQSSPDNGGAILTGPLVLNTGEFIPDSIQSPEAPSGVHPKGSEQTGEESKGNKGNRK